MSFVQNNKPLSAFSVCAFVLTTLMSFSASAKVNIVTTTPDLAALAAEVGGDHVTVKALSSPDENPHYVDPRPSLMLAVSRADLLILTGLELEIGWLPPLLINARNGKVLVGAEGYLDASTAIQVLEIPKTADRAMGDIHPGGNPHYMFSPTSGIAVSQLIAARLSALDPVNAAAYAARAERVKTELVAITNSEIERFARLPAEKRLVVTYHRSLVYLLEWLGIERPINVEPKPGVAPNPAHVARVLGTMRTRKVNVILQERFYPTTTSDTLARLAPAKVVVVPGGTDFANGERYADWVKRTAGVIYDALAQ